MIEKHFLTAGYGVVERESIAPIFSEYQLQSAGATADASKRVKLKPAFWVVGGSWKWLVGQQNKLSVSIDINKMGGGEQLLSIAKPPGAELEKAVVDAIQDALKASGSVRDEQALAAEEKFRTEQLAVLTKFREEARLPSRFNTNATYINVTNPYTGQTRQMTVDPAWQAQREGHKEGMLNSLKQSILLYLGKDMGSKWKMGRALYGSRDPAENRSGEQLLQEVADSGDPVYAIRAKNWLDDVRSGKISFERDKFGMLNIVIKGQPASFPQPPPTAPAKETPQPSALISQELSSGPPTSAEELRRKVEAAMKAGDRVALVGLVYWQNVPAEDTKDFMNNTIASLLNHAYAIVKLAPLNPHWPSTIGVPGSGYINRPNIPLSGEIQVTTAPVLTANSGWTTTGKNLMYGKVDNVFYIAVRITEKIKDKPVALADSDSLKQNNTSQGAPNSDARRAFLQSNFSKFVPVQFQKDASGNALVQRLHVQQNKFEYGDKYYCGFQFTVPTWIDGDFEWLWAFAKTKEQADYRTKNQMGWYIVPQSGQSKGFENYMNRRVAEFPLLKQQFPYSGALVIQDLEQSRLEPGKTYAIWFCFQDEDLPDIGFSMTIDSERGRQEFGELPLQIKSLSVPANAKAFPTSVPANAKGFPTSAEQFRRDIEAVIKAKDIKALSNLFCWKDVPEEQMTDNLENGLPTWFNLDNPKVTLIALYPGDKLTNVVNGLIHRPNIPVLGYLKITTDRWGNGNLFPYGKFGDGYYVATRIDEPVKQ